MSGRSVTILSAVAALAAGTQAVSVWGQCGGIGYTGSTSCDSGSMCSSYNPYYYQCIPGTAAPSSTTTTTKVTTTTTTLTTTTKTTTKSTPTSTTSSSPPPVQTGTKYLITFGDSYSQTGFNISLDKPSAANPLGNPTLPGWTASGGLNWVGFLTSKLNTSLTLSYNFAYGGATTDASLVAPYTPTVLSFIDQVTEFSNSIASHPSYAPWTAANTLVGVWIGVNDVGNSWWLGNETDVLNAIMDKYFQQLQTVYNAGARNFALLSVPPINLTPAVLAQGSSADGEAAIIKQYNDLLASRLATFKTVNSGVNANVVDTGTPFMTAINNPTAYGAPNATCYNGDGVSCLWFNDYHPGIAINKLVAQAVAASWKTFF